MSRKKTKNSNAFCCDDIGTGAEDISEYNLPGTYRRSQVQPAKFLHYAGNQVFRNRTGGFDRKRYRTADNRKDSCYHSFRECAFLNSILFTTWTGVSCN